MANMRIIFKRKLKKNLQIKRWNTCILGAISAKRWTNSKLAQVIVKLPLNPEYRQIQELLEKSYTNI
jgi:hypothetical protein